MTEAQYTRLAIVVAVAALVAFGGRAIIAARRVARISVEGRPIVQRADSLDRMCTERQPRSAPICTLEQFDAARAGRAVAYEDLARLARRLAPALDARERAMWQALLAPLGVVLSFFAVRWALTGRVRYRRPAMQ